MSFIEMDKVMAVYAQEKDLKCLKLKIKAWEGEFTRTNKRKPLKEDIQQASSEVKDAYKEYWTLKKNVESQETNREDVWSEKFNKSKAGQKNLLLGNSDGIFKKFCSKIRERSSDIHEVNIDKPSKKEAIKKILYTPVKSDNLSEKNLCELDPNCDNGNTDTGGFDIDINIIKPPKRIMKFDNVSKKLRPVNVLATVDMKSNKNILSFETSVDHDWLERCIRGTVTGSENGEAPIINFSVPCEKTPSKLDSLNFDIEVQHDSDLNSSSHYNSTSCAPEPVHHTIIQHNSDSSSPNVSVCKETTVDRVSVTNSSKCDDSDKIIIGKLGGYTDVAKSKVHTSDENNPNDAIAEKEKGVKRKLSKTYTPKSKLTSHLERKMASGTLNENFVKVNIKKKKFSRGHKSINVKKLKWKKWKDMKKFNNNNGNLSSPSSCFKCGQVGHWARNCKVSTKKESQPDEGIPDYDDDAPLMTLDDVAKLARQSKINVHNEITKDSNSDNVVASDVSPDDFEKNNPFVETDTTTKPIYELLPDGQLIETPSEVFDSLKELGYSAFRKGQETAVMRILSGQSTLVVLPTGSGKSLCYQLPAYIYGKHFKCVTLVISPLVSLMEDQVKGLPSCLHAICLHSGMTEEQKKTSLQDLKDGKAHILLVSPEAVIAYGSGMLHCNMPPIAFACIDEAHCLSQWSHNFRPSYLQLYKVLTERYNVKCILGLTATANQSTSREIISHLGLSSHEESVIGTTGIPDNLHLAVSRDKDKDRALIELLTSDRFSSCSSIIIYCIRRDETERLATLIRTCLQDMVSDEPPAKKAKTKSKKRNFLWTAEAYHAGLAPPRRRSIQKQFMTGKLRVIVATIAFGMGLDKRDVRAIIHYNMPKSFESYVQEIGRAGRDGLDSYCHLFLNNEGKDMQELQRFIYSNSTDRYVIRKLLRRVFVPDQCKAVAAGCNESTDGTTSSDGSISKCPKHEIAFPINETVQELDLKEENILTLLCYLELHSKKWIEILPSTYSTCTIRCYGGPKQLHALAAKSLPVAAAFALDAKKNTNVKNISSYQFQVVKVASVLGWSGASVKHALKSLEWNDQRRKTGVIVDFSDLAFHLRSPCNFSDDQLDEALDFLHQKVIMSEKKEIFNLKSLHSIFSKCSHSQYWACCEESPTDFSQAIKDAVNEYFDESSTSDNFEDSDSQISVGDDIDIDISDIKSQIRDIIYTNNDQTFTGRAIARIFHGIGSPCFPPEVWGRVYKFWRCLLHVNFNFLLKLANEELKRAK